MWRGYIPLVAIVIGGVVAAGAASNSFGGLAQCTSREAIYQPADDGIDVTIIVSPPGPVAIPASWQFEMLAQFPAPSSSASSVDTVTNIDTLTDIDTLTT